LRLSIIMEWANTRLNGVPRAWAVLDALGRQWLQIVDRAYPDALPAPAARFLDQLDSRVELVVGSGEVLAAGFEDEIKHRLPKLFDVEVFVAAGLEYYPLKNHAAQRATGDILLFLDSDVVPDPGWLAHLLGSFGRHDVDVVCGQSYVAPMDTYSRAFAVGWTYPPRAESGKLYQPDKFYANNIAFRAGVFRETGFPSIGRRTRGASSLLRKELSRRGIPVWENQNACVDHPPPSSFRHLAVRAIAHGRDHYMKDSEERNLHGLVGSVGVAARRLGRGYYRAFRYRRRVGLKPWEMPAALAICSSYYLLFALGGVMTHLSPRAMGRHFRV